MASTTMYKWVDAQGVVHYSDSPQPGAEVVHIQPVQTYKAPAVPLTTATVSSGTPGAPQPGAPACSITSPQPDQEFFAPDSVAVAVSVNPSMQEGDQLQVLFDGTPVVPLTTDQVIIQQPSRGSHNVSALVRGADGRVRCNAGSITFNVQRPSALSPQSPVRAH